MATAMVTESTNKHSWTVDLKHSGRVLGSLIGGVVVVTPSGSVDMPRRWCYRRWRRDGIGSSKIAEKTNRPIESLMRYNAVMWHDPEWCLLMKLFSARKLRASPVFYQMPLNHF
jgi:hypothetical protein